MMTNKQELHLTPYLKELRLPTIRACYTEHAEQARVEPVSYEQYLLGLVEQECDVRR